MTDQSRGSDDLPDEVIRDGNFVAERFGDRAFLANSPTAWSLFTVSSRRYSGSVDRVEIPIEEFRAARAGETTLLELRKRYEGPGAMRINEWIVPVMIVVGIALYYIL